jgi:hypothetical protein
MKRLILFTFLTILLTGCSQTYRAEGVNDAFPNSEVAFVPTHSSDFIVRDPNGTVWYVRCDHPFRNTVTSKAKLFLPQQVK